MASDGVGRKSLRMVMKFIKMFEHIAEIVSHVELSRRAGCIDSAQDVENGAAISSLSKLRSRQHALFDSERPLAAIIRVLQCGMGEIKCQLIEMVDHIHRRRVQIRGWWPYIWSYALRISSRTWNVASDGGDTTVFHGKPDPAGVATAELQNIRLGAPDGIDPVLDLREHQKTTQHVVAKTRVVSSKTPERSSRVRTTARDRKPKLLLKFRTRKVRGRQIALEDQRARLRAPPLKQLAHEIANAANVGAEKPDRRTGVRFGLSNQKAYIERLLVSCAIGAFRDKTQALIDFVRQALRLFLAYVDDLGRRVVTGKNAAIGKLFGHVQVNEHQVHRGKVKNAADLARGKLWLANDQH